jgi:hypothetical protein
MDEDVEASPAATFLDMRACRYTGFFFFASCTSFLMSSYAFDLRLAETHQIVGWEHHWFSVDASPICLYKKALTNC